ncbi:hypothetical protein CYMTET_47911 [Cymbomonas tetramitiformis]|uniref:Uncharacterized protein n=1 Tax=Cymbomonas tetramitiformis TaxID=36881 RepID=A0AAE0BT95_9CHLO|nr:hypothetical protein CYMTET_47911 [Cymbomonas tetramitiformis]
MPYKNALINVLQTLILSNQLLVVHICLREEVLNSLTDSSSSWGGILLIVTTCSICACIIRLMSTDLVVISSGSIRPIMEEFKKMFGGRIKQRSEKTLHENMTFQDEGDSVDLQAASEDPAELAQLDATEHQQAVSGDSSASGTGVANGAGEQ